MVCVVVKQPSDYTKARWERLKNNPEKYERHKAYQRAYRLREGAREKHALLCREYMARLRSDPVRYAAYLEKKREYWRSRKGNISVCRGCGVIKRFCTCPNKEVKE